MQLQVVRVLAASLLLALAALPAFAGTKGSKSESATAAWLVVGDTTDFTCQDGNRPVYVNGDAVSKRNDLSTGKVRVWVSSADLFVVENMTWEAVTGNSPSVYTGDLDATGESCGNFVLMELDDHSLDGDLDGRSNDNDAGGEVGGDGLLIQDRLSGSWSFKFSAYGKNWSADSARF